MTQKLNFVLGREENTVGIGENTGTVYEHFLIFQKCFKSS